MKQGHRFGNCGARRSLATWPPDGEADPKGVATPPPPHQPNNRDWTHWKKGVDGVKRCQGLQKHLPIPSGALVFQTDGEARSKSCNQLVGKSGSPLIGASFTYTCKNGAKINITRERNTAWVLASCFDTRASRTFGGGVNGNRAGASPAPGQRDARNAPIATRSLGAVGTNSMAR